MTNAEHQRCHHGFGFADECTEAVYKRKQKETKKDVANQTKKSIICRQTFFE